MSLALRICKKSLRLAFILPFFNVENSVEIEETFQQFLYQKAPLGHYTRGLYEKGIK